MEATIEKSLEATDIVIQCREESAKEWGAELLDELDESDSESSSSSETERVEAMKKRSTRIYSSIDIDQVQPYALGILSKNNPIRKFCINVFLNNTFNRLVLIVVILNTLCLAIVDPLESPNTVRNQILDHLEIVFNSLFTIEMAIKIIALGFLRGKRNYLSDAWNRLDFIIVVFSWISVFMAVEQDNSSSENINFGVFRAVRVLKVLRTVHGVKGIRTLVISLLDALGLLVHVISLLVFLFFIFGIMGLQLFQGSLRQQCYPYEVSDVFTEIAPRCSLVPDMGRQCPVNSTCVVANPMTNVSNPNPNFDITSFDDIVSSFLTIFQCISLEGWVDVMYWSFEAKSKYSSIYFVSLISLGALFVINLVVAVIHEAYERKFNQVQRDIIQTKISLTRSTSLAPKFEQVDRLTGTEVKSLIARFDIGTQGDQIDYQNFLNFANPGARILRARQQLRAYLTRAASRSVDSRVIFRTLDANGDGDVDEQELRDGLVKLMIPMDDQSVSAVFHYLDSDGSGGISISEFFNFAAPPPPSQQILEDKLKLGFMTYECKGLACDAPFISQDQVGTGYLSAPLFRSALCEIGLLSIKQGSIKEIKKTPERRNAAVDIVENKWFARGINLLIVANTLVLSMKHHDMDPLWKSVLDICNTVFTVLFAIEMVVKWRAMGIVKYVDDRYNVFDMVIVWAGIIEIGFSAAINVTVLRTFRLFRVFRVLKLARYWSNLKILMETILRSWKGLANFSVLLLLMIYIYALCGMDFYGGKFTIEKGFQDVPRANFDTFYMSLLTVFQVLSGENWNEVMYDCVRVNGALGAIFIVSMFFIGNYIMLNLFLAILLQNFESAENDSNVSYYQSVGEQSDMLKFFLTIRQAVLAPCLNLLHALVARRPPSKEKSTVVAITETRRNSGPMEEIVAKTDQTSELHDIADEMILRIESKTVRRGFKTFHGCLSALIVIEYLIQNEIVIDQEEAVELLLKITKLGRISTIYSKAMTPDGDFFRQSKDYFLISPRPNRVSVQESIAKATISQKKHRRVKNGRKKKMKDRILVGHSLWIFAPTSPIRVQITNILMNKYFDWFILLVIALSSVTAALDSPDFKENVSDEWKYRLWLSDLLLTIVFGIEMLMKIISGGFLSNRFAYLRDGWNVVDFVVVCFSVINLIFQDSNLGALKAIRSARALRPLRVVSRNQGMKIVVNAIFKAMPSISNVFVIILIFFLIFGIIAVDLFGGRFHFCLNDETLDRVNCTGSFVDPDSHEVFERVWTRPVFHFDNIFNAMLVLFEMSTLEMWPSVMTAGMDVTAVDMAPQRDSAPLNGLFFVAFITICSFFIMSLFLGIVIFKFDEIKEEENGSLFLTDEQRKWVATQRRILTSKPYYVPKLPEEASDLRVAMFNISTHQYFDTFIMFFILSNVVTMAMRYYGESKVYGDTLEQIQQVFTVIFTIEAMIKFFGLGQKQYFDSHWNCFDFAIVISSIITDVADQSVVDVSVLRAFRVARLIRLLKNSQGMMSIMKTVMTSLPSLFNVGSLLLLLYFVFAILGMNIFGQVTSGECVTDVVNFRNLPLAILTLFRSSTGESWNCLMHDYMVTHPIIAPIYFILFNIFGSFIVLNLLIAVILENFSDYMDSQNAESSAFGQQHLDEFQRVWGELAGCGELFMHSYYLAALLRNLAHPLGLRGSKYNDARLIQHIRKLDIKQDRSGRVFYLDVFHSLCRNALPDAYCNFDCSKIETEFQIRMGRIAMKNFKGMKDMRIRNMATVDLSNEINAATGLQAVWRSHKIRTMRQLVGKILVNDT